jgi:hypothetical protein
MPVETGGGHVSAPEPRDRESGDVTLGTREHDCGDGMRHDEDAERAVSEYFAGHCSRAASADQFGPTDHVSWTAPATS